MDSRLFFVEGTRFAKIRKQDVPNLARALIAVARARATILASRLRGVDCIRIIGPGITAVILKEDWVHIQPLIADGTLNPAISPRTQRVGYLHPDVSYDESVLDMADRALYNYLVAVLEPKFPEQWPTSTL